jgi:hypothetical protein
LLMGKAAGEEARHSLPSSVKVKCEWRCAFSLTYGYHRAIFTFTLLCMLYQLIGYAEVCLFVWYLTLDNFIKFIILFFVMKTNLMHYLSLIYFVKQPLHVSGIFIAHHQEVFTVYVCIAVGTCYTFRWLAAASHLNM